MVAYQPSGEALNILLRLLNERCAVTWTAKEVGHGQFERVSIVFSRFWHSVMQCLLLAFGLQNFLGSTTGPAQGQKVGSCRCGRPSRLLILLIQADC